MNRSEPHGDASLERNAAGDIIGVNKAPPPILRFRVKFSQSALTATSPSSSLSSSSMMEVTVPIKNTLSTATVRNLVDEFVVRVARRFPQVLSDFAVAFIEVPVQPGGLACSPEAPLNVSSGGGGNVENSSSSSSLMMRLDAMMSEQDTLDCYFDPSPVSVYDTTMVFAPLAPPIVGTPPPSFLPPLPPTLSLVPSNTARRSRLSKAEPNTNPINNSNASSSGSPGIADAPSVEPRRPPSDSTARPWRRLSTPSASGGNSPLNNGSRQDGVSPSDSYAESEEFFAMQITLLMETETEDRETTLLQENMTFESLRAASMASVDKLVLARQLQQRKADKAQPPPQLQRTAAPAASSNSPEGPSATSTRPAPPQQALLDGGAGGGGGSGTIVPQPPTGPGGPTRPQPAKIQYDTVVRPQPATSAAAANAPAAYDDVGFANNGKLIVVIGCGVYRIGSSVEFDYSGVLVSRELRKRGYQVLLVNYNPETVSTDYDECDRLYFDEISDEVVLDIVAKEKPLGVIISVGGQTAQNMALELQAFNVPVIGTSPTMIDCAEDRNKFSAMCDRLQVDQPQWASLTTLPEARAFASRIGYPVLVRPSYVLSGSAMAVIWQEQDMQMYLATASRVSGKHPVVISKYFLEAKEYDVDIVAHEGNVLCYAVCEHVENAGTHSGDATMFLPPQNTDQATIDRMLDATRKLTQALQVTGPMNVQFLLTQSGALKVIEANLRSSRSVPFVSKALGLSFPAVMVEAFVAAKGAKLTPVAQAPLLSLKYVACKAAMFSFVRLGKADPILGVEMSSTGEVGVFGRTKHEVFLKALMCVKFEYPKKSVLLAIDEADQVIAFLPWIKLLAKKLVLYATSFTAAILRGSGVACQMVQGPDNAHVEPNVLTLLKSKQISLVIQLRDKTHDFLLRRQKEETASQDYKIRRLATDFNASLITDVRLAELAAEAIEKLNPEDLEILPYQSYVTAQLSTKV